MATLLGSLLVSLGLDSAQFKSGMSEAERSVVSLQRKFQRVGQSMSNIGQKMSLGVTLPVAAFSGAAIKAASDAEEMQSAFNVVFGDMAADVTEWAKITGDAMGRSTQEIQRGALAFQELFGKSLDPEQAVKMSKEFAVLTQDLASFKNLSNEVAQQKLFSGLVGEAEPLRSVGVFLSEAAVQAKAAELGIKGANGALTDQQKIVVRAAIIQEQLADAQGDVVRTAGSTANQFKAVQAQFEELSVTVGQKLLPIANKLLTVFNRVLTFFTNLPDGVQTAIIAFAGIAAIIGPVLFGLGQLVSFFGPMVAALMGGGVAAGGFGAALAGIGAAIAPLLPIIAAVAAAGALIYANWGKISPVLSELWNTLTATLGPSLREMVSVVMDLFRELWDGPLGEGIRKAASLLFDFQIAYAKVFGNALITVLRVALKILTDFFRNIADGVRLVSALFRGDFRSAFEAAGRIVDRMFGGLPSYVIGQIRKMVQGVREWVVNKLGAIWQSVVGKIETVKKAFFNLYDAVVGHSYVPDMVDGIAEQMRRLDTVMVQQADKATEATAEKFRNLRDLMDRLFPESRDAVNYTNDKALLQQAMADGQLTALQGLSAQQRLFEDFNPEPMREVRTLAGDIAGLFDSLANSGAMAFDKIGQAAEGAGKKLSEQSLRFKEFGQQAFGSLMYQVEGFLMGAQSALDVVRNLVSELASMAFRQFVVGPLGGALGIPGFAKGTNFAPGGLAIVGEKGPELVNLPRGSQVVPNHELKGMGGGNSYSPTFNFPGVTNAREAREAAGQAARRFRQSLNGPVNY